MNRCTLSLTRGAEGFERYKLFYLSGRKGAKYYQPKGTANRLYIPESAAEFLDDVRVPLVITEGEKKTLKACQEFISCIGISGLWNWPNKGEPVDDFNKITLKGRIVYIVPGNNYEKPNKHGYKKT